MADSLADLARQLDQFARDRDWQQFHSPKNLASALVVEAGELLEHFQWLTEAQSRALPPQKLDGVGAEVADVLLYLVQLASALGINPIAVAQAKLKLNAGRYPIDLAREQRGSALEYAVQMTSSCHELPAVENRLLRSNGQKTCGKFTRRTQRILGSTNDSSA